MDFEQEQPTFLAEPLTRRELEIVSLLANGLTNREIADALTVALSTVKWYTKQIYSKLGVNNRKTAVVQARNLGLLDDVSSRHTLPVETTKFIGRETELQKIKLDLKDPGCRMLTLIGLGGIGKTRLAIKAANDLALEDNSIFKDGIHFIPLAAQLEVNALAATIAEGLDFPLSGSDDPAKQLERYLRGKKMLLVLDNFEQLLDGTQLLSDIISVAPKVKLVITSRESLNLPEEWRFEVAGLPVPNRESRKASENSAVRLFVERASHVRADFSQNENTSCIAHICRLLDGMPLAIELAAAWIRSLSCQDIAAEIESNQDFLKASMGNIPGRHRSLRSVLDQTWSRLSDTEREVFKSLSLFRGGFTLSAARSIAAATADVLTSLVDKSLVKRVRADRYQMHELLKKYAAEKLAELPETERAARSRHLSFYSQLAFDHQSSWGSHDQHKALLVFKSEINNIIQAWNWSITTADAHQLNHMIFSINEFFYWQGRLMEGIEMCQNLLNRFADSKGTSQTSHDSILLLRCKALLWMSIFITQLQNSTLAKKHLAAAQELFDSLGTLQGDYLFTQAHVWLQGGRTRVALGDVERADEYLRRSLTAFSEMKEDWGAAASWAWLGMSSFIPGNFEQSRDCFKKSLSIWSALGDRRNIASSKDLLAVTYRNMDQYDRAEVLHLEAVALARELNDPMRIGWMLHNLTWTYWFKGEFSTGVETGLECVSIAESLGNDFLLAAANGVSASCLMHRGEFNQALTRAEFAYSLDVKGLLWQPFIPLTLGEAAFALGNFERAFTMIGESSKILLQSRRFIAAIPLSSLSLSSISLGKMEEAKKYVKQSLSISLEMKRDIQVRRSLVSAAVLKASRGEQSLANILIDKAFETPHFSNSKWYGAILSLLIEQYPDDTISIKAGTDSSRISQESIWRMAEMCLE